MTTKSPAEETVDQTAEQAAETLKDTEKSLRELIERGERALQQGLETLKAQSRTYADSAGEQLDVAQKYVTERVQERPLISTGAALGLGVLIGFILASGRER
jgi:ElaB/YqjD/DUF883 family membrane-anchored ribosome-binding protein